ncbi:cytochrome c-type biogenesis protein [Stutzerimonas urumqiensis]|uniref:cytochrome c-type biogenesis protein n=1 Tax=Stutzerimonas urumqiensis TaxID=638269 RepID=UPI000EB2EDC0|nr:cytochrome c-type biogenesis protein [Stutzerimonas urumqiensis]
MKRLFASLCLLACSLMASAAIDTYTFDSEAERERYRSLTEELRCPKCQNQNIADSNSPIAMDLRDEIYRMLQEGRSNEQIVDYLVARYGDFVRYRPPLNPTTFLLWYGPFGLLAIGLVVVVFIVTKRRRANVSPSAQALSPAERERLAALLDKKDP